MEPVIGIPEFFKERSVFVTGGTGFMGKVLVEKLLRSCQDLDTVYVLIRPKKGQHIQTRLAELLNAKIFDWLRKNRKDALNKVTALAGDITSPNLGLSHQDLDILFDKVSIVFHAAATVKFDEPMKLSTKMNVSGTKYMLDIAEKMTNLESFVHVSTAYCNCQLDDEVQERVYPAAIDPKHVLQVVDILSEPMLEKITPNLLDKRPNTYTYTKALGEHLVHDQSGKLPIAIFRPSIVTASWKEPLPGWVDNLNGFTGILIGAGKGILHSLLCRRDCIADLIPVDLAINCMIAVAWSTAVNRPNNILVFNCTTGSINPILWRDLENMGLKSVLKYPSKEVLMYPGGNFKTSQIAHEAHTLVTQWIPAYLLDIIARLSGRKPIMVRLQEKIRKTLKTIEFFSMREFKFRNDNMLELMDNLKPEDKAVFNFDPTSINWDLYIESYVLGTRKYILKEDPSTIPDSRANIRRLFWFQKSIQMILLSLFTYAFLSRTPQARTMMANLFSLIFSTLRNATNLLLFA